MTNYNLGMGQATLQLQVNLASTSGNTWDVNWAMYLLCNNGVSWNANPTGWSINIMGQGYNGNYTFDFRSTNAVLIASGHTVVGADSRGNQTNSAVSGQTNYTGTSAIGGPGTVSGNYSLPRIPHTPTAVRSLAVSVTGRNAKITFTSPSDNGGAAITNYLIQYSLNGGGYTGNVNNVNGTYTYANLAPGSYTFKVTPQNSVGNGTAATTGAVTIKAGGKVWNGSAWVADNVKVWNGSSWVDGTVKVWNGSSWVAAI